MKTPVWLTPFLTGSLRSALTPLGHRSSWLTRRTTRDGRRGWIGQSVEILHANHLFMGIPVPDGEHSVTLEYRPIAIPIGICVTTGGLLAIAAVILLARRPRRTVAPG